MKPLRPLQILILALLPVLLALIACAPAEPASITDDTSMTDENPFLEIESGRSKADTAYVNTAGKEIEVDLEADVSLAGDAFATSSSLIRKAPADIAQFALTYLRGKGTVYLESLAESLSSRNRVEWLVDGEWLTLDQVDAQSVPNEKLTHFRIRAVNAVVLTKSGVTVETGTTFTARVPLNPYSIMTKAGDACAYKDGHITLSNTVYWYMWAGDHCDAIPTQEMTITVSRLLPAGHTVYPEYDQLVEDGKVTTVFLIGQLDDGPVTDKDAGMYTYRAMVTLLEQAGYDEELSAPVGRRFQKDINGVVMEIDLYSPFDFGGLGDFSHFGNLQKAITEHEIVIYDGHSMLGASDFWARPEYPSNYQIFLYGGCLGYEYYVRPIFEGKGGQWGNLDLMSSVIEVTADSRRFAAPVVAKIAWAIGNNYRASWQQLIEEVRMRVGDPTFGVSGIRDNAYCPPEMTCGE